MGIGTDNPTQSLTVNGSAQISGKFHDSSGAAGTEGQTLLADSEGKLVWADPREDETGISELLEDATPELGGALDVNGNDIISSNNGDIKFIPDGTGKVQIENALELQGTLDVSLNQVSFLPPVTTRTHESTSLDAYSTSNAIIYTTFTTGSDVTSNQTIYESGATGKGTELLLRAGELKLYAGNNATVYIAQTVAPNTAYSVAVVYDLTGNKLKLYLKTGLNEIVTEADLATTAAFTQNDFCGSDSTGVGNIGGVGSRSNIGGAFMGTDLNSISLYQSNLIAAIATASSSDGTRFVVKEEGVGIGTDNPTQSLSVEGSAQITGKFHDSRGTSGTDGLALISDVDGKLVWGEPKYVHEDINVTNRLVVGTPPIASSQEDQLQISNVAVASSLAKNSEVAPTELSLADESTSSESTKLTVHGSAKITGKFYDSSGTSGKAGQILTADTSGKLVWNNTFNPKGSFTVDNLFTTVQHRHIISDSNNGNGAPNFEEFDVNRIQVYNANVLGGSLTALFNVKHDASSDIPELRAMNQEMTWGVGYVFSKPYFLKTLFFSNNVPTTSSKNLKAGGGRFKVYNRGVLVFSSKIVDVTNLVIGDNYLVTANVIGDEVRYVFEDGDKTQDNGYIFKASDIGFLGVGLEDFMSKPAFTVNNDGKVGIGTLEPSSSLTVSGSAQITGILKDSSGASGTQGQTLFADSEGKLVWSSPPSDNDHANLVVSHSLAVSTSPVIIGTLEPFVPSSIKTFNATIFYGKPSLTLDGLFNGKLDDLYDSSHIKKGSSEQDGLEWGLGYKFSKSYAFRELKIQTRADSYFTRAGGGVFRIYNNGDLVYSSQKVIAPNAGGQYTDPVLINVVGDEVHYIFENGNAAQDGEYIFNASELVISGNNIDNNEGTVTSFLVSQDQIDMTVDKVVINHGRSDSNPTSLSLNADWVVPGAVLNVAGLVYIAPKVQRSQTQAEVNSILNDDYKDIFGIFSERQIIAPDYAFSNPEDWADYVFEKDYDLLSLQEEKDFINENGHLPGFPSKEEVEDQGYYSSDELNMNLLRKVEELTLHLIKQNEDLKVMKSEIEALKAELVAKDNL